MALSRRTILHGLFAFPAAGMLGRPALPGLTATVYNGAELANVLSAAGPGSTVTLAPGDYGDVGGELVLPAGGVSVRAQVPEHTVLRTGLVVHGDEVELDGLTFAEGIHLVGSGLKIAGSKFDGRTLTVSGIDVEVMRCKFTGHAGTMLSVSGSARNPYIHHNSFYDGSGCAIYIGSGMNTNSTRIGARIETNTIKNVTGGSTRQVICVKSSGNLIVGNTVSLSGTSGYLSNRHGYDNAWRGNIVSGGDGIRNQDGPNRYIGNSARNLSIMAGNAEAGGVQGTWPASKNVYVEGNQGTLRVGTVYSGFDVPASGTYGSHDGTVLYNLEINTSVS